MSEDFNMFNRRGGLITGVLQSPIDHKSDGRGHRQREDFVRENPPQTLHCMQSSGGKIKFRFSSAIRSSPLIHPIMHDWYAPKGKMKRKKKNKNKSWIMSFTASTKILNWWEIPRCSRKYALLFLWLVEIRSALRMRWCKVDFYRFPSPHTTTNDGIFMNIFFWRFQNSPLHFYSIVNHIDCLPLCCDFL